MSVGAPPLVVEFGLPPGWLPVDEPFRDGVFAALATVTAGSGFSANIAVRVAHRADNDLLPEIAEEVVARLRADDVSVRVIGRGEYFDGFAQQLVRSAVVGGRRWDVVQNEVFCARREGREQVVLRAAFTCTVDQFAGLIDDFDAFVGSIRFVEDGAVDGDS